MRLEAPNAMPHHPDRPDYRELLHAVFGSLGPDAGQIEWVLDRIEGTSGSGTWA